MKVQEYPIPRKNKNGKTKWFARIVWHEPDGTERVLERAAQSKTHAKNLAQQLAQQLLAEGSAVIDAERMTFRQLAEAYKAAKVVDAIYEGEIKVAGMRAKREAAIEVDQLVQYWGDRQIQKITHPDIEAYKLWLIKEPVIWRYWKKGVLIEKQRDEPRSIASVNHRLSRLSIMLNFALRKRWITRNPFKDGESLIAKSAELPRDRAPAEGEFEKLLTACVGRREHLRAFILCLADTGLRVGEARRLIADDVDLEKKLIRARAQNTKTNRERWVPIPSRLAAELAPLIKKNPKGPLFGEYQSNKSAWDSVREAAGAPDLQLRDLRHWALTEHAQAIHAANMPWQHGMAISGHSQVATYLRYLNKDEKPAAAVGAALEDFRKKKSEQGREATDEPQKDSQNEWVN